MITCYILVGFPASGKSTALNEAYSQGLYTIETSEVVRDKFQEETPEKVGDDALGDWATEQRNEYGVDVFALHTINRLQTADYTGDVALSGIRCVEEVDVFKSSNLFDEVEVIGIEAGYETRFQRMKNRDDIDREYFESRMKREKDWGVEKVMNRETDLIIRNDSCSEKLFRNKFELIF